MSIVPRLRNLALETYYVKYSRSSNVISLNVVLLLQWDAIGTRLYQLACHKIGFLMLFRSTSKNLLMMLNEGLWYWGSIPHTKNAPNSQEMVFTYPASNTYR